MVLAGQPEPLAFRLGHNWGATVGTDVIERFDLALLGVDEYHGLARAQKIEGRYSDLQEYPGGGESSRAARYAPLHTPSGAQESVFPAVP